ncbi:MAG: hypothetical protein IKC88_01445, partial [Opitutales bacterium]|nr:hypothetical protein [Opitutales bacterium]
MVVSTIFRHIANALLCAFVLSICACTKPPKIERGNFPLPKGIETANCQVGKYGGIFVLAASQEPKTFNPLVATDTYSAQAISLILSPLVTLDPIKDEIIPALAESWKIQDGGKTYIFKLREGIKFSDGVEITADDVIFTFETIFKPVLDEKGNPKIDKSTKRPMLRYPSRYA